MTESFTHVGIAIKESEKIVYIFLYYSLVSCDFELNTCSWRNEKQDDNFEWQRQRGSTPTLLTGPRLDNTKQSRYGKVRFARCSRGAFHFVSVPMERSVYVSQILSSENGPHSNFI